MYSLEPSPSEQVDSILVFFDDSVDHGTLVGNGPGSSGEYRLNALRNTLEATRDLIGEGYYDDACAQLQDIYNRCDGESPPPDFAVGQVAPNLAGMILDLRASLGCE